MEPNDIIIEPVVTEKTNTMRERHKYAFRVDSRANKFQIVRAVQLMFDVHPKKCNIANHKGKPKRVRYHRGYTAKWKKAIITLPPGETISVFEGA